MWAHLFYKFSLFSWQFWLTVSSFRFQADFISPSLFNQAHSVTRLLSIYGALGNIRYLLSIKSKKHSINLKNLRFISKSCTLKTYSDVTKNRRVESKFSECPAFTVTSSSPEANELLWANRHPRAFVAIVEFRAGKPVVKHC